MDETVLFYNVQPNVILAIKGKRCSGGKMHNNTTNVLLSCNKYESENSRI
jgi:hypothetical protein